jgi:hypothetical protein
MLTVATLVSPYITLYVRPTPSPLVSAVCTYGPNITPRNNPYIQSTNPTKYLCSNHCLTGVASISTAPAKPISAGCP